MGRHAPPAPRRAPPAVPPTHPAPAPPGARPLVPPLEIGGPAPLPPDDAARDRRLMEAVRAGDEDAFRCLFDRYWDRLVAYAAAILDGGDECQDVALQAFARAWSHRASWTASGTVSGYLYRLTRNLALNARRDRVARDRRQRRARLEEPSAQHHRTPAERMADASLRAEVEAAVARLPARRREAFELSRYHGLSHREIAETLGIAPQTVANQIGAALAELRDALAHHLEA